MAKIKMRNARVPSEGVPEPEVEQEVKEGSSGGVVNVTINPNPDVSDEGIAFLLREMHSRPSILESLAAAAGSGVQNRLGFGSRILRAAPNFLVQSQAAQDMIEQLATTTVLSRDDATALVESNLRGTDGVFNYGGRTIAVDPAQPGSDRTVLGFHVVENPRLLPGEMVVSSGQRSGRSTARQILVQELGDRMTRLMAQFDLKSREALRREGIDPEGPSYRGERMSPDLAQVRNLFESPDGPDHIVRINGIVYWGVGRRRVCMMECEMDTRRDHRGVATSNAVVAFMVTNPRNRGMQPFGGSMQYNETIGFFVYNASQGGSL